jgi:Flp pilus assembly protein TadB
MAAHGSSPAATVASPRSGAETAILPTRGGRRSDRTRSARMDVALGLAVAAVALVLAPGLGVVAAIALLVAIVCVVSLIVGRRRSARRQRR